ncbi:MAG: PAS domain S-box protein [Deltaproteobacteria bacterium]|nr:PAS domain S-box protein [Deltaproteobacteria bacterium]
MEPINTSLLPDYRLFKRLVIIAVAMLILCTAAFSAWKIITEYRLTIHAAELQTRGYASALKEHAERALNEADTTLQDIIEHIEEHGGINMKSRDYLHGILDIHIRISPQIASVFLVNRDGQLFEHTLDAPVKQVSVADRDYFIHHRDTPADKSSFLSKPLKSRISGKWRIILSRSFRGAEGEFAGVVAVALDPDYFHKFYAALDLGRNGNISMVRRDGALLLSVPLKPSEYETGFKKSHLIHTRLPLSPRGTFHIDEGRALPKSNARIVSYDSLEYFPVVSLANMDEDEVLARWEKNTFIQGVLIAAVSSALYLLALVLLRKMKLIEAACQVQKEQQTRIAASAGTWQSTFDAMEEAVWVMDTDRIVLRANKATERIFGRRLDQVIGNICCETVHGNKSPISNCPFQIMLDTGHRTSLQIMLGERWCYVSIDPVKNDAGEITGAVHIVSDITELKQAEQQRLGHLRYFESMDRVNRAIQGTNDIENMMSDVLDAVLTIFDCDRAFLMYPCDPEAATWSVPMKRTRPEYPGASVVGHEMPMIPSVAKSLRILLTADGPVQFGPGTANPLPLEVLEQFNFKCFISMVIHPKQGKPWQFGLHQCSYARVWTPNEEKLFREIGRRLADALTSLLTYRTLRESEDKLAEAQRIAHIGYWDRNLDDGLGILSEEACRIFGLPPQERVCSLARWHERLIDLIHPEDRLRADQAAFEALPHDVEYRVVRPNGEVRFVHSQGEVTRDESGRARRWFGTIQDITEHKLAEEALLAKQQKLTEMAVELSMTEERERRRIAAELHDHIGQNLLLGKIKLNSLVNALPAAIDIDRNELGEILLLQDQVIRSVRSLTQQLSPPILAGAGLESALEWLGKQMENDYALQVLFVDDRKPKPLTEDMRTIVYQACRELLINVAKHAGTKSARVAVCRERDRFCLMVEDQGTGFDFTGAANCGLHDIGFGLFSIRERIKHLEGEVILESAPGQGTRVTLRVAIAEIGLKGEGFT